MNIAPESPDQPDVVALIDELDAYQLGLYPPESVHSLDLAALLRPEVSFFVARDHQGRAVGCGALVLRADHGEIKRMYVHPEARGQGLARRLMQAIESAARAADCRHLMLETGPSQPEALALYAAFGFMRRGPFAGYAEDPLSVFMEKRLPD